MGTAEQVLLPCVPYSSPEQNTCGRIVHEMLTIVVELSLTIGIQ